MYDSELYSMKYLWVSKLMGQQLTIFFIYLSFIFNRYLIACVFHL